MSYSQEYIEKLNQDIKKFPQVRPVTYDMTTTRSGIARTVWLDRYAFKDLEKKTLDVGDFIILTVKEDPKFPTRGFGQVIEIDRTESTATILVEEEFRGVLVGEDEQQTGIVVKSIDSIDKPLEIFYEQVAMRNATGLASVETTPEQRAESFENFYKILKDSDFVPAGRVQHGAGSDKEVTYFNCYVMPHPKDSRDGIADHRKDVAEIMSRGGGVGTNISSLRPRRAIAKNVGGISSGAVSWLNDISQLTPLIEQGGSRRGAQMGMMADWHPDILEFIISKMQNPDILRYIMAKVNDQQIKKLAQDKLKFTPLTDNERLIYECAKLTISKGTPAYKEAVEKLRDGGHYTVHNSEFLTGMNISVCLTNEFMQAVENDTDYDLRFPDLEKYTVQQKADYDEKWHEVGDVREWAKMGYPVKTHRKIKASILWELIAICATYSAEPGIYFYDTAIEMTNATAYGQKPICTNPCGEQPLPPWAVCNLSAVNLARHVNKKTKQVDWEKLRNTVRWGIRMMDNIIDKTPYFIEKNRIQAQGERRLGMGEMGLADMLIYMELRYGSPEANVVVDQVHEFMTTEAYQMSIELAAEKGSFPFLRGKSKEEDLDMRYKFIETGFMKKMPDKIRKGVLKSGIRNSHVITVAPTGSTGTAVGVSTGLEPYFGFEYYRNGRLGSNIKVVAPIVQEYLDANPDADPNNLPAWFVTTMELSPEEHADTQCVIQRWVDSSISKTVNAPKGFTVAQVQKVYERLWKGGAKGGTVYVDGSRNEQVLNLITDKDEEVHYAGVDDFESAQFEEAPVSSDSKIGTDIGDTCPVCQAGEVIESGGCHTCNNCNAQLLCGL